MKKKQDQRVYDLFVERLKSIRLHFRRPVSQINNQVVTDPVTPEQILKELKTRFGLPVKPEDLQLSNTLDSVGEHFIAATFFSPRFQQSFNFSMVISLVEEPNAV